ncbi:hypothetical protein Hamer_G010514, partial [Homarus americanus]
MAQLQKQVIQTEPNNGPVVTYSEALKSVKKPQTKPKELPRETRPQVARSQVARSQVVTKHRKPCHPWEAEDRPEGWTGLWWWNAPMPKHLWALLNTKKQTEDRAGKAKPKPVNPLPPVKNNETPDEWLARWWRNDNMPTRRARPRETRFQVARSQVARSQVARSQVARSQVVTKHPKPCHPWEAEDRPEGWTGLWWWNAPMPKHLWALLPTEAR